MTETDVVGLCLAAVAVTIVLAILVNARRKRADENMPNSVEPTPPAFQRRAYGALAPPGSHWQIGDRVPSTPSAENRHMPDDGFDSAGFAIGVMTGVPISPTHGVSTGALIGAALHSNQPTHSIPSPDPTPTPSCDSSSASSGYDGSSSGSSYDSSSGSCGSDSGSSGGFDSGGGSW